MNVSTEVLNNLFSYLSGATSLQSLREWEVQMFLRRRGLAQEDQKFLMAFERHFAELSLGLPEPVFKRMLRSLAQPDTVVVQVTETEFERFDNAVRQVLTVSKTELLKREAEAKKESEGTRRPKK